VLRLDYANIFYMHWTQMFCNQIAKHLCPMHVEDIRVVQANHCLALGSWFGYVGPGPGSGVWFRVWVRVCESGSGYVGPGPGLGIVGPGPGEGMRVRVRIRVQVCGSGSRFGYVGLGPGADMRV
jgi:hypothetical protein